MAETVKRRVFIVDDHPIVRNGLAQLINQEEDLEVCGEAGDAAGATEGILRHAPDIVLLDISLEGSSGLTVAKGLRTRGSDAAVLVLSMHDETVYAERALRAGVRGYIMKQARPDDVLKAIREVLAGGVYLSEQVKSRLVQDLLDGARPARDRRKPGVRRLSDRELEIYRMVGAGNSTRQIADHLKVSPKTVETHRENIKHKLGLKNATELLYHAIRWVEAGASGAPPAADAGQKTMGEKTS